MKTEYHLMRTMSWVGLGSVRRVLSQSNYSKYPNKNFVGKWLPGQAEKCVCVINLSFTSAIFFPGTLQELDLLQVCQT